MGMGPGRAGSQVMETEVRAWPRVQTLGPWPGTVDGSAGRWLSVGWCFTVPGFGCFVLD